MFFKKILIKFLAMPLVVIMIWINGIVSLLYKLTLEDWINKKRYKKLEKDALSLYHEKIRPKMSTII